MPKLPKRDAVLLQLTTNFGLDSFTLYSVFRVFVGVRYSEKTAMRETKIIFCRTAAAR
jgi:hypothetical protein